MKNHVDLCEAHGMIDYQRGAKIAGNGAWLYRGWGARMEWALLNSLSTSIWVTAMSWFCRRTC